MRRRGQKPGALAPALEVFCDLSWRLAFCLPEAVEQGVGSYGIWLTSRQVFAGGCGPSALAVWANEVNCSRVWRCPARIVVADAGPPVVMAQAGAASAVLPPADPQACRGPVKRTTNAAFHDK